MRKLSACILVVVLAAAARSEKVDVKFYGASLYSFVPAGRSNIKAQAGSNPVKMEGILFQMSHASN